jgi:hypothetical protein
MLLDVGCKWYLNSEVSGGNGAHIDDGFPKLAFDNKSLGSSKLLYSCVRLT